MYATDSLAAVVARGGALFSQGPTAPDPTELSDSDLEHVVGGLTRIWIPAPGHPEGAGDLVPIAPPVLPA